MPSFIPVNISTTPTPYLTYSKVLCSSSRRKYRFLSPNIARIFELYTINELVVIANIARIESIAKIKSEPSIKKSKANNGVA